jgi:SAM-dependent methyltransferase
MSGRGHCLGCEKALPKPFLDLGKTPLANAYLTAEQLDKPEPKFPLAVVYCPACHLVQLTDLVPPEQLFSEYLYFSSYSETFLRHAEAMARDLSGQFQLGKSSRVLEIASNDGYLLQYFQKLGIPVLGIEPARNIAEVARGKGIPTLTRFFGLEAVDEVLAEFGPSNLIIGNNVLAHVPGINGFLKAVEACLAPRGVAVFEFPALKNLLDKTEFDTIYHEHVFYYSLWAIERLAARAGLELFDAQPQAVHGGTLRVFLSRPGERPKTPNLAGLLTEEAEAGLTTPARYESFGQEVARIKAALRGLLAGLKAEGKRLAAYGAPAKGNTLLNTCGIGRDLLDFTVDRSPHKQGRFLPGTRLPIYPPEHVKAAKPDYLLILPWNIKDEIMSQMACVRTWGGQFVVPIPQVEVIP